MSNWIENDKKIYQREVKGKENEGIFRMILEDKCDEKGYSVDETKEIVKYVMS